jgi:hypothetical protein
MIKANELRIGNWVYYNGDGTPFKVLTIEDGGMSVESVDEETWIEYDQFSPIDLTPEILEKAGFAVPDGYQDTVLYNNGLMIDFHLGEYKVREHSKAPCKYLHQLQNLYYALTGQELIIEL